MAVFVLATSCFGSFAFAQGEENGGFIKINPSEDFVSIVGSLGGRQNNRFLTFYITDENSLTSASYVGFADVEYTGGFKAEFPVLKAYDTLVISNGGEKYSASLSKNSYINLSTGEITEEGSALFPEIGESYKAITGTTAKERFLQHKQELPSEMSVVKSEPVRKGEYAFYVATDGSDSAEGTEDAPFATIKRAFDSIAALSAEQRQKGTNIYIKGGTYSPEKTLTMTFNHKGAEDAPLYISTYNGEEVIIEHGTKILGSSFKPVTAEDDLCQRIKAENLNYVYVADLAELGITEFGEIVSDKGRVPDLFEDGEKMHLARYPDEKTFAPELPVVKHGRAGELYGEDFAITDGLEFAFSDKRPLLWTNDGNIAIYGGIGMDWFPVEISVDKIGYNESAGAYTVSSNDNPGEGVVAPSERTWAAPTWYYWYNVLEECDSEGEWYIDRNNGKIYVYTQGDIAEKSYTWVLGSENILDIYYSENVVINGITFRGGGCGVMLDGCKNIKVQNCTFLSNSVYGLYIQGGDQTYGNSRNCGVCESVFLNNGTGGVVISGRVERYQNDYKNLVPSKNYVQNCYIAKFTDDKKGKYSGISVEDAVGCVVSHNLLQGFDSNAIGAGGVECIYEYNELVNTVKKTDDMGSIYWSGFGTQGNHIRYNYLHAPYAKDRKTIGEASAFFADELGSNAYVYGNIAEGYACGMKSNGGQNLTFFGNVVMNTQYSKESDTYPTYFSDSKNFFDQDNAVWERNVWSEKYTLTSTSAGFGKYFSGAMDAKNDPWKSRFPEVKEYTDMLDTYVSAVKSAGKSEWNGRWSSNRSGSSFLEYDTWNKGKYQWLGTGSDVYNEAKLRAPSGHVISNNIVLNNGKTLGVPYLNSYYTERSLDEENSPNLITTTDPGFADYENGDYAISASAVSDTLSGFETIPFEKVGLSCDLKLTQNGADQIETVSPKSNGALDLSGEVLFQWKKILLASNYRLVVSENADLSNPVVDVVTDGALYRTSGFENGKKYYWQVTATSDAKDYKDIQFSSIANAFWGSQAETVDFAEANMANGKIDLTVINTSKSDLNLQIFAAEKSEDGAVENAEKQDITIKKNSFADGVEFAAENGDKKYFVYLWDSFLKPYAKKEF